MRNKIIAAIIPTHNRKNCLRNVLQCLQCQIVDNYKIRPIVIVDGSSDGTLKMLKTKFPNVDIVNGDGNWWYTKSINKGIERALSIESSYILTLNDDIVFGNKYITELMSVVEVNKEPSLVGSVSYTQSLPHRITFSGIKKINWRLKEYNYIPKFSVIDPKSKTGYLKSVNLSGRGLLFNAELINKLGYYDQKLVQYSSDTDFSYRAHKAGVDVFISYDAIVYENEKFTSQGASFNKPSLKEYISSLFNSHSINSLKKSIYFYWKHGIKILFPLYIFIIVLGQFYMFFFKYRNLKK